MPLGYAHNLIFTFSFKEGTKMSNENVEGKSLGQQFDKTHTDALKPDQYDWETK